MATWERMQDLLRQLGEKGVKVIDRRRGFEPTPAEGIETIVLGSYIKAGETFATDVKVLDVGTKKLLRSAGSKGEGVSSIINNQIDELTREISGGLATARNVAAAAEAPIADVTRARWRRTSFIWKGGRTQISYITRRRCAPLKKPWRSIRTLPWPITSWPRHIALAGQGRIALCPPEAYALRHKARNRRFGGLVVHVAGARDLLT